MTSADNFINPTTSVIKPRDFSPTALTLYYVLTNKRNQTKNSLDFEHFGALAKKNMKEILLEANWFIEIPLFPINKIDSFLCFLTSTTITTSTTSHHLILYNNTLLLCFAIKLYEKKGTFRQKTMKLEEWDGVAVPMFHFYWSDLPAFLIQKLFFRSKLYSSFSCDCCCCLS